MRIRLILLALIAALTCPVLPSNAQAGATLRLATPVLAPPDLASLPLLDLDGRDLAENLYAGLFRYDAATHSALPVLAESWTTSADGLTWTLTLRDDIFWVRADPVSGQIAALRPVTAADVVYALRRACHPLKATPASPAVYVIAGCRMALQTNPLLVTDALVERWVQVEAPDESTLVLHLAFPATYLPSLLTLPEFRPLPPEAVEGRAGWSMVGSGPYTLTAWTPGQGMTLARNPFWPEALPGNVALVEVIFAADPVARAEMFARGEVQFTRLGSDAGAAANVLVRRGLTTTLLGFSTERAFVREVKVRQALAWAIDREALRTVVGAERALPATTLTPPGVIAGPLVESGVGFAPEAARAALAEAGYAGCTGVPERVELLAPPSAAPLAQALIGQWAAVLGCDPNLFTVRAQEEEALRAVARNLLDAGQGIARSHLWITSWTITYPDAQAGAADALHCRYGMFVSGLGCTPLDDLIELAGSGPSATERPALYARLEARYFGPAGEYPAVPLLATVEALGVSPDLRGVPDSGPAWWGAWEVLR